MKMRILVLCCCLAVFSSERSARGDDVRAPGSEKRWVGTWVSAQQLTEPGNLPPAPGLGGSTLRQIVQVSLGGSRMRVTFSNVFGEAPLRLRDAEVALAAGGSAILPGSSRPLLFHGQFGVTVPPGAVMVSDPVDRVTAPMSNLAVTVHVDTAPANVTGHPGSRTTSFLRAGAATSSVDLPGATAVDHWYLLSNVDVWTDRSAAALVTFGDSITDGRGSTHNQNNRWPNLLFHRLQSQKRGRHVAVLNQGIGGNRLLRDGLGPNALARLDRDVISVPGVRWLIVLEGINDLGTAKEARANGETAATAADMIAAYEQIILRAHSHDILVYGATLLPYEGAAYFDAQGEADRQQVNSYVRSGRFDGVIDFDAIARDPQRPSRLSARIDGGDHLHPSPAGYQIMAGAVDLSLFFFQSKRSQNGAAH